MCTIDRLFTGLISKPNENYCSNSLKKIIVFCVKYICKHVFGEIYIRPNFNAYLAYIYQLSCSLFMRIYFVLSPRFSL